MFENVYEISISLVVGLILGALIFWLYSRRIISEREEYIKNLETSVIDKVENLNDRVKDQDAKIESLKSQLDEKEETISNQNIQIQKLDDFINVLKTNVTELENQSANELNRAETAETRVDALENKLIEKEQELATLLARTSAMQDDLTVLDGIGPKVSSILRLAGVNSFQRLADIDENRIREILEAENPGLLQLTDPTTWPEQARIAAEGDWESINSLKDVLKRTRQARKT